MATKEQELTYQNIIELFTLAEKLTATIKNQNNIEKSLEKLKVFEPFIIDSVHYSELLSENYAKIIKNPNAKNQDLKEDISKYIASIIDALILCNNKLRVEQ
jgi:hypothetical protein